MQCAVMEARPLKNLPEYDPDVLLAPVECLNHITCKYLHRNRLLLKGCKHPRKTRDINAYFKENEHFLFPSALEVKMKTANIYNRIDNRQRKFSSKSKGNQVRSRSVSTQNNSEGRRIREAASDITYSTEYRQVGPSIGNTSDSHRRSSRERKSVYETYNLEHVWDADYQYWLSNLKKIRKSKQTEEEKDDSVLSSGQLEHTTSSVVGENNHVVQELTGNEHKEYAYPYQCDICKEVFVVMRSFRKHLKTHPESTIYKCTDCNYEGKTKRSLSTHVKVHHTGSNSYKCDTCHKVFKRKSYLTVHKVSHCGRRFTCLVCGKKFKFKAGLKTHMFSHSDEFPYECDACGKGFNQSAALKVHKRSHTGERPFKCMHCPKAFPSQANRDAHVRTHTGEKPYKCLVCGKCFSDPGACKRHRLIHTGEKPHKCSHCGRRFNDTGARDRHERLHTGLKPFQCDVCDKRFRDSSGLITHTRYHTGERFKCDLCGKKFIVKGGLNAHMKTHAKLTVHAR